ncbi:MAG: BMP family ABC transporter substrate-binding protein [Clostridiales bacterium]|nr:BMP family ABC transporter substrate-binding protein [Clostridiales bacterium]
MNKKLLSIILIVAMVFVLVACGKSGQKADGAKGDTLKVVCLLNGNLGDKSFHDSANNGMTLIKEELGIETKVIEMGFDNAKWEPNLFDVSEQDYDVIIVGTYQMQEVLEKVAPQYPDKKYIIFDSTVEYDDHDLKNVYSVIFKQNEASYLAGALASMIASDSSISNGQKIIGAVGGMEIPVINDFIVGYIQGAQETVEDIKVAVSYIGDFDDTAKAKELALAQFNLGSSVGFNVAAQAGLGLIDAAKTAEAYAIGVDADQAMALKESNPDTAKWIVSSVLKNIDQTILRAIKLHLEGKLPYGETEVLGLQENALGLADNEIYRGIVTQDMIDKIAELQEKIEKGEIKVKSAFDMTAEELEEMKESVQP